ncbi:molybdopterin molybdotransferase MoeA [bacterium]|nr:molybdopterin molybdotransferase MoeA [bacterium]
MVSVSDALRLVREGALSLGVVETDLAGALGRALARDVVAPADVPPFVTSAMDGAAVRVADIRGASEDRAVRLRVAGTVFAGPGDLPRVDPGTAVKVMTGGRIPPGGDAVVPLELYRADGDGLVFTRSAAPGENIRPAALDARAGEVVFTAGERVTSAHIGVLASLGLAHVTVGRAPRVAVLATGAELVPAGMPLLPGMIVNSNGPALVAAVREAGGEPIDLGIAGDDAGAIEAALASAADADVVLTTGGVSVGERDLVKDVLRSVGVDLVFDAVAQQPGKPLSFGRAPNGGGTRAYFGLPGNPSSALVCFEMHVRPLLRLLAGFRDVERPHAFGRFPGGFKKRPGRAMFVRVNATATESGYDLSPSGSQSSGLLAPMARGRRLAYVPAEVSEHGPGDAVKFWFLDAD